MEGRFGIQSGNYSFLLLPTDNSAANFTAVRITVCECVPALYLQPRRGKRNCVHLRAARALDD